MKLVSGTMPTRGRQEYAREALDCFLSQTYPAKELLILDDQDDPSFPGGLNLPNVQYKSVPIRYNIPTKRNMLCEAARGEILMHFDSDDWSAPERMADQVERLWQSGKSLTGYSSLLFKDEATGRFYRFEARRVRPYALGTSLAFTKQWWSKHPFLEKKPIGSDNEMFYAARDANDFIVAPGGELMFARIHPGNTSAKYLNDRNSYTPVEIPQFAVAAR